MTIKELREKITGLPDKMEVVIHGDEGDFWATNLDRVEIEQIYVADRIGQPQIQALVIR